MIRRKITGYSAISKLRLFSRWGVVLVGLFLAGCGIIGAGDSAVTNLPPYVPRVINNAEVFFWVQVPEDTPIDGKIQISLVDEITGLDVNNQNIDLLKVDEEHYGTAIRLRVGSVIKYRYVRDAASEVDEYSVDGKPVRYRLYYVDGPGEVHDIIPRWADTTYKGGVGRIEGKVSNTLEGQLVNNLMISIGGKLALTDIRGNFVVPGLPPGPHQLTVYAMDGAFTPVKQIAVIAKDSATVVTLKVTPVPLVDVTFRVKAPKGTISAAPLRMAGNLIQLGNAYTDLGGGISGTTGLMPVLTPENKNNYSLHLQLPAGAHVRYKYTLGDGYWNAEHDGQQNFVVRELIVPADQPSMLIEDSIKSWSSSKAKPITFIFKAPDYTPLTDQIYIQFKLDEWMAPLPMWNTGANQWQFELLSPTSIENGLPYRYCRNGQCGGERVIAGEFVEANRITDTNFKKNTTINDTTNSWKSLQVVREQVSVTGGTIEKRKDGFVTGIALAPAYQPGWQQYSDYTLEDIRFSQANTVVFSPTWSIIQTSPPIFAPVVGQDVSLDVLGQQINAARQRGFKVVLYPQLQVDGGIIDWWALTPYDEGWWRVWFDEYRNFILNFADFSELYQVDGLVIGGEWISPALPANGAPKLAKDQWSDIISRVNNRYDGDMIWLQYYGNHMKDSPDFIGQFDQVYVELGASLGTWYGATLEEMQDKIGAILDNRLKPLKETIKKPIILVLAYPSAQGGLTNCIYDTTTAERCLPFELFSPLYPDNPDAILDLREQADVYNAVLSEVNQRQWVSGVISEGYFPPVALEDKSISIHGKTAQEVLRYWFGQFLSQ